MSVAWVEPLPQGGVRANNGTWFHQCAGIQDGPLAGQRVVDDLRKLLYRVPDCVEACQRETDADSFDVEEVIGAKHPVPLLSVRPKCLARVEPKTLQCEAILRHRNFHLPERG